jgi:hypothetical protein
MQPLLELKIQSRVCPVSLSVSMNVCIEFVSWLVVVLQLEEQNCMQTFSHFSPLIAGVGFKPLNMRLLVNGTTHLYVLQKLADEGTTERILQFIMELKLIYQKNCFNEQKCLKNFVVFLFDTTSMLRV